MYKDANKNITSINYNHLNLPTKIVFYNDNFSKIEYLYDASGKKLKKVVYVSGTIITTDYLDGYQYENAVLKFFPTAEGYVNATQNNSSYLFNYVYNYTDHLGNIRLSYGKDPVTGTTKIIKENNYYPFGLSHNNYNMSQRVYVKTNGNNALVPCQTCPRGYQYKFGQKELQDELGLNVYDYGARNYDPALGRWMNIDPLAEKHPSWSPYNYTFNNPLNFIDPDGRDGIRVIDEKNKTITIKAVYYVQTEKSTYYTTGGKMKTLDGYSAKEVASMQKDYNKYLNDLGMNVSEGEYKGYSIKYDLQFKEGGTIEASEASASKEMQDGYSIGNSFSKGNGDTYSRFKTKEIDNGDGTTSTSTLGGVTADNKNILMNTSEDTKMNRVHEIFHTFGFGHPKGTGGNNGIMKYPPEKPNQTDANNIGNSSFLPKVIVKQDGQN